MKLTRLLKQLLEEQKKKADRCKRIADRKYDKPSAYKSGAIVRCRKGEIWKDLKEEESLNEKAKETLRTWFKRKGAPGKEGGWVDCNTCRDGKCKLVVEKKVKNVLNTLHVVLHLLNVKQKVKVKNGVKPNKLRFIYNIYVRHLNF